MILRETHKVPANTSPIRLSDYVPNIFTVLPSRAGMRKVIKKGWVKVDGQVATTGLYIKGGEIIELFEDDQESNKRIPDLKLKVLYEDDHLAVIFKPAGILVSGNKFFTIDNALAQNLILSKQNDALSYPRPAHRLDYPTSGLLLIGKTLSALTALNQLFENKKIHKTYYAVTSGEMNDTGDINVPIDGKNSHTNYNLIQKVASPKHGCLNLVKLVPSTGRRHQLRIHLAHIGHPILGDKDYGTDDTQIGQGLYLHAGVLDFVHPVTKSRVLIKDELPKKFRRIFELPL